MNYVDFAVRIDNVVVVERAVRIEYETLHWRVLSVEPQGGYVKQATTIQEYQASHLYPPLSMNSLVT